jgi:streptomycin 6-kinase
MPSLLLWEAEREQRQEWLAALPETVGSLKESWSMVVGEPYQPGGHTAWVAPATGTAGEELVLKVAWRHDEAAHEAEGLRQWNGSGSVRLIAVEDFSDTTALLLERCVPGTALSSVPERDQDIVIARLLQRLWCEPEPDRPFRPLHVMCDAWAAAFEHAYVPGVVLDPGLAREGIALLRSLGRDAERQVLLCTDLHAGNVLAAKREPWLVIDPKPYVSDPVYDPLQHILNCGNRLRAQPRDFPRRIADLVGVDPERLLLWLFARYVQESLDWPSLAPIARQLAPT